VRDKQRVTEELVKLLDPDLGITVKIAQSAWWFNLRKTGGMRLTTAGYDVFVTQLNLENYSYTIDDPVAFTQHTVLDLDRKMQMPYYIHMAKRIPKKIILFGNREAVMINLYGNLHKFLDGYQS
jgi:hypothetical protein